MRVQGPFIIPAPVEKIQQKKKKNKISIHLQQSPDDKLIV